MTQSRRTEPSSTPRIPVWLAVAFASAAMLGGVSSWGLVEPFDLPLLSLALTAVTLLPLALAGRVRRMWRSAQARRIEWPALALAAAFGAATLASPDPATSLLGSPGSLFGLAAAVCALLVVLSTAWLAPQVRVAFALAAPWITLVQVGGAVWQLAAGQPIRGSLSNATYLSMVLALCVPAMLARCVERHHLRTDPASLARLALAVAAVGVLAAGGSRTGAFVCAVAAAWVLAPVLSADGRADRRSLAVGAGAVTLVAAALALAVPRIVSGIADGSALGTRPEMWRAALRLVAQRPLLGFGPDSYHAAAGRVADVTMMTKEGSGGYGFAQLPTDPHNVVLALAVAAGLAGIAAAGWLAVAVARTWRGERAAAGRLSWPAIATLAFLATAMMAPVTLQDLPLFALVAGCSIPLGYLRPDAGELRRTPAVSAGVGAAWAMRTAGAVALALVVATSVTHLAIGPIGTTATTADALAAQGYARLWRIDPFLHYVESARFSLAAAGGTRGAFAPAVTAAERSVAVAPADPFYRAHLAYAYLTAGDASRAATNYRAALEVFPNSPDALEGAGFALLTAGDTVAARGYAERALVVGPGRVTSHRLAAEVYRALGDTARADAEAAKADALAGVTPAAP